jgi:hypothetical protein
MTTTTLDFVTIPHLMLFCTGRGEICARYGRHVALARSPQEATAHVLVAASIARLGAVLRLGSPS